MDGLRHIPKEDPETCHDNFDQTRRRWLPSFGTPESIVWIEKWMALHPRLILRAQNIISVHGGALPGEPQVRSALGALPN